MRLAYELAKEQGLLPTPQVFVRPHAKGRRSGTFILFLYAVAQCCGSIAIEGQERQLNFIKIPCNWETGSHICTSLNIADVYIQ